MQTKKEEVNLSIIQAAEREFFLRGYKEALMRKIAERAYPVSGTPLHLHKPPFPAKSQMKLHLK